MTPKEFFDKVVEMRRCQKEYLKNKRQIDLRISKQIEREVDEEIERVQKILHDKQNPQLFGEHRITNVYLYLNWENVSKKMKVRTQQNFNRKTRETVFGISIMPDGGRRYCKYPIGHQEYKDYTQAHQAMKDVQKILDNGGRLVYSPKGSAGINKNEYVKIEMT